MRCDHAVAKYKESQKLKDLLRAARDGPIMEKFNEWSQHGYLDRPRMVADLLTVKAKAQDAQPVLKEGPLETHPETAGDDMNVSESEDEEELGDSAEKDQA